MAELLFPDSVYITRGNHEDYLMNKRYGFEQEASVCGCSGGCARRRSRRFARHRSLDIDRHLLQTLLLQVVTKYKAKASTLLRALAAVFSALPLGVIINHKVGVTLTPEPPPPALWVDLVGF